MQITTKAKKLGFTITFIVIIFALLPLFLNLETKVINTTTRTELPGQFIKLSNGYTHYEESGPDSAQTVLLVHGFSVPFYVYDSTFYNLVDAGFHVIRFDLYGRGFSDRPHVDYNKHLYEQQIFDLLNALKIKTPINIVGLSMGGPITSEFTVNHPDKINKVTLIAPLHESVRIPFSNVPGLGTYLINIYLGPTIANKTLNDFYNPSPYSDLPSRFKEQMYYKGFKRAIHSTLLNYINEDKLNVYTKLGQLKKPVLLIWGKQDTKLPYVGNERIRKVLNCEFLSIDKAGHIPHFEQSGIVNRKLIEFLKD